MIIGYARVSTDDQTLDVQRATLRAAGCERIYEEKISGAYRARPELDRMLEHVRAGDVVTIARLDRLARSTRDLLEIAERLKDQKVGLRSLQEPWADTTSPSGVMILTVFAGIATFERELIKERTGAGRALAKAKGVKFGRRRSAITAEQWGHFGPKLRNGELSVLAAATLLKCNRATVYRRLAEDEAQRRAEGRS
ncbi:recombinase family protein [Phenylobacterium sp. LjRoot225]|uniref:recombinase family protein n=1 Tax=Phenylobacterium sp. LjRoot225 TaxID=3342285 RepID=UPI003ED10A1A